MQTLSVKDVDFTVALDRKLIDNEDLRDFALPNSVGYYIKTQDPALRQVGPVRHEGIDLIAKSPERRLAFSVTPIFNIGFLEKRVIEQAGSRKTDIPLGYVEHVGTLTSKGYRGEKEVKISRVTYIVHSHTNGVCTSYIVTDTYIEGDVGKVNCQFISKMV